MNDQGSPRRYSPLGQLMLARFREFYRRPEAVFWVYGFPLLMVMALGIAFRNKPIERITVDVLSGPGADFVSTALRADERFAVRVSDEASCRLRLRTGRTDLLIVPPSSPGGTYEFRFDRTRPESMLARRAADDILQRAASRKDVLTTRDVVETEPGGRYIDFLVPGLIGMGIMGGGLWGVGFSTVDLRIRKLLKRFVATPMHKSHFLLAIMLSRFIFIIPEMTLILLFAYLTFGVVVQGSLLAVAFLIILGSFTFSGIGLLVACRASTLETVSGLMNLVMLPLWVLSGIFFSPERFPASVQPVIQVLPLTPLISALRSVTLEGSPLWSLWPQLAILGAWGAVTFTLALLWFRWV